MKRLFTSEAVSEGHPDKIADQISDAILDYYLVNDGAKARVGCETMVTTGQVIVAGEVKSSVKAPVEEIVREVIHGIGYEDASIGFAADSVGVLNAMHTQSPDISQGVDKKEPWRVAEQGAGDQGMMFGYATNETPDFIPFPLWLANKIMETLSATRKYCDNKMLYLRPDSKAQVTVEVDENGRTVGIDSILVSTQHKDLGKSDDEMLSIIRYDIKEEILRDIAFNMPKGKWRDMLFNFIDHGGKLLINPTGRFVVGGPMGDTGLTGRKIIADTYGGYAPHGGGAFSGKDPSKVDRSAAYMARYIAKHLVAAGIADEVTIQLAYAIGMPEPVSFCVTTKGNKTTLSDVEIADKVRTMFDLTPYGIRITLALESPIYQETAAYGHFGRNSEWVEKDVFGKFVNVKLFPWEDLDNLENVMKAFEDYRY